MSGRRRQRFAAGLGVLGALAGSACEYSYGVALHAAPPFAFADAELHRGLRALPGADRLEVAVDGACSTRVMRDGAEALVVHEVDPQQRRGFGVFAVAMQVPDEATLRRQLALLDQLVAEMSASVPGFPPAGAFRREWIGLDAPRGAELARLRALVEAPAAR